LPDWIQRVAVDEPSGVKGALDALLSLTQPPTAIFCINDHLGLQVYEELGFRGLRIPGDISLVGFDGLLRWLPGGGYLTTASQDFERMGQLAAELAIERIAGGKPNAYRHYLLDAPILNRSSSGRVVLY
jgi:LacI family transcriptional regulator